MLIEHLIQTDAQFLQNFDETLLFQLDKGLYYGELNNKRFFYLEEMIDMDKFSQSVIDELYAFLDNNGFIVHYYCSYLGLHLKESRQYILKRLMSSPTLTGPFSFSNWYLDKVWEDENIK